MSGGGKSQTSKSKTVIPEWVKAQYLKATDMASKAASKPWQAYSNDPNAFVAGLTDSQRAGMSNINQYAQSAQPWYEGAGQATVAGMGPANLGDLNIDKYMNPYLRNVAQTQSDLMNQQNQQAMSGQLGTAIMRGGAWGDRSGVSAANLNQQQNLANAKVLNDLLYQGYGNAQAVAAQQQGAQLSAEQQNLARLMSGGQQLGELGSNAQAAALAGGAAQMQAGQQEQQTEQAKKSAMYTQFLQEKGYDFQTAQFFANIAEGIGANAGSSNTLTQPAGFFSGLARGGRAGKAAGGGLGAASMGGHVGAEHAMEGFADGGMPQDYSAMVMQALFGGVGPSAGAYGMAGGMPGGMGFVPQPNMQVTGLKPAEAPPVKDQTSAKDVANAAKTGYDMYNSEEGQKALDYAKNFLGFTSLAPSQARGGRTGYAMGGSSYSEDPIMGAAPGLAPTPSFIPPPDQQNTGKGLKAPEAPSAPPSDGLGKVADIAKIAATIIPFFLKDGGVAGPRRGYDTGGAPQEQGWGDWLDSMLPMNGPMADLAHRQQELQQSASGLQPADRDHQNAQPAAAPAATWQDTISDAALGTQKYAADTAKGLASGAANDLGEAWNPANPDTPWANRAGSLVSGLAKGLGVVPAEVVVASSGMANKEFGHPQRGQIFWPGDPNATSATAPAAPTQPASSVVPSAAAATPSEAPADFRPTPGLNPAPAAPTTAAAAPPIPKQRPAGLVPDISPVYGEMGTPVGNQSGLQMFQANAFRHEGDAVNRRDPNGGTRAGFNLAQYRSINPSIRSLADVQQHDILDMQSKWWRNTGGDAVEAKYGPQFAASYADLSMLNPTMAQHALAQAGGDPTKFFDIMGGKLATLGENPKYAPNTKGWLNRVADNKNFALTGAPVSKDTPTTLLASGNATALPASDNRIVPGLGNAQTSGVPQIRQAADELAGGIGRGVSGAGDWMKEHQNILLPILQGLGAMASSPSRYLGSAILQGVGAGAGSYMKRQSQLANIANTQAQTGREAINAAKDSIHMINGVPYVITANGRMQRFYDWQKNPVAPVAGGELVNNYVRQIGQEYLDPNQPSGSTDVQSDQGGAGMPVSPAPVGLPTGVPWTEISQKAVTADEGLANTAMAEQSQKQSGEIMAAAAAEAQGASQAYNNLAGMARTTSEVLGNPGGMQPGAGGAYKAWAIGGLNGLASAAGLGPGYFGNADSQSKLLEKYGALAARNLTPQQYSAASALQEYINATPNFDQPPAAMKEVMVNLLQGNQMSIDHNDYMLEYAQRSPTGIVLNGNRAFYGEVSDLYQAERDQLQKVIANKDVANALFSGSLTLEQAQTLLQHALGDNVSPVLARYFVKG